MNNLPNAMNEVLEALTDAHFHLWHILGGVESEFVCTPNQKAAMARFEDVFQKYALMRCPECADAVDCPHCCFRWTPGNDGWTAFVCPVTDGGCGETVAKEDWIRVSKAQIREGEKE
jgi:hypothetical protein